MIMKFRLLPLALASLTALSLFPASAAAADAKKPNILLIYVDDMGYGQLGCYGNKDIPTPNIDALAKEGVRFTQGYVSAPLCSPSRAGLMSGHYQERFGHDDNNVANDFPKTEVTLPERMKALGYDTAMVGKWHLGALPGELPMDRGFSEFFGSLGNPGSYFTPHQFIDSRVSPTPGTMTKPGFYTTDAYTDRSCEWITNHRDKPWFLYLAYNAVHAPYDATQKYLDRFKNEPDPKLRKFKALFSNLDDGIGRVMQTLHDTGEDQNTLIFFISDNGSPYRDAGMNGPLHGYKYQVWEGGIRIPYMMVWKGKLTPGTLYEKPVVNLDVMPTCVVAAGGQVDPAWKLDGVDLVPYLTGAQTGIPHEELDWRIDGMWAARKGDLKLLHQPDPKMPMMTLPQLFDLSKDLGEQNDLAPTDPKDVQLLKAQWDQWNSQMAPPPPLPKKMEKKGKRAAAAEAGEA
jgi:arylsulfatase A-like enzyme